MEDELLSETGLMGRLVATLDKGEKETRDTLKSELIQAGPLLERVEPILKSMYREKADKDFDLNAANYAVQVAFGSGYRRALRDVHALLYPDLEVTK